jgi:hypothetical protein
MFNENDNKKIVYDYGLIPMKGNGDLKIIKAVLLSLIYP